MIGRDFKPTLELNVPTQVDKLIEQAHSLENLCILYVGWCPVGFIRSVSDDSFGKFLRNERTGVC
jgi:FATC domain